MWLFKGKKSHFFWEGQRKSTMPSNLSGASKVLATLQMWSSHCTMLRQGSLAAIDEVKSLQCLCSKARLDIVILCYSKICYSILYKQCYSTMLSSYTVSHHQLQLSCLKRNQVPRRGDCHWKLEYPREVYPWLHQSGEATLEVRNDSGVAWRQRQWTTDVSICICCQARAGCPIDGSDCKGYFSRGWRMSWKNSGEFYGVGIGWYWMNHWES